LWLHPKRKKIKIIKMGQVALDWRGVALALVLVNAAVGLGLVRRSLCSV
jgi:hypothetical protein